MGLMTFREKNKVKWIGTRPGHRGTQVIERKTANDGAVTIYTVPAGKVFHLCTSGIGFTTNIQGSGYTCVTKNDHAFLTDILRFYHHADTSMLGDSVNYWPPMELPAGYYITVVSDSAGLVVAGWVYGWVEDA